MPKQLTFDLPSEPALGRGDFFVSSGNAVAVDVIQTWHDWPNGKLVLVGPKGSGKTHLVHVWASLTGARIVEASGLRAEDVPALASGPVAVENADRIAGISQDEAALFHLHNLCAAQGVPLLITAAAAPARWGLALPDLASRMQGSAVATLAPPDDALLAAVLVKLFADRQISVDAGLVGYLVGRMERSFAGAGQVVAALDAAALEARKPITKALAKAVLDKLPPSAA